MSVGITKLISALVVGGLLIANHELDKQLIKRGIKK